MESNNDQDLPSEIFEKLRNLELELEDGDITLKGFEKKKASLLADFSNPSSPTATARQKSEAELLEELGPEPSAADVVDFLDFLPSPTHSPTRTVEAVPMMEDNHRQIQHQQQQQQQQQQHQQQISYQQQQQQQQQYYQQSYVPQPQQHMRPQIQPQYRPYNPSMGRGPGYNISPPSTGRPYLVPRNNGYSQQPSHMRPMPPPGSNPYYSQRPPSSASSSPIPPQNMIYRTQQQPVYTAVNSNQPPRPHSNAMLSSQPISTSPRLMYRPTMGYIPQQQPQQPQYGNYSYNNSASINRSLSTNAGTNNNIEKQRQDYYMSMHSSRSDSLEWNQ